MMKPDDIITQLDASAMLVEECIVYCRDSPGEIAGIRHAAEKLQVVAGRLLGQVPVTAVRDDPEVKQICNKHILAWDRELEQHMEHMEADPGVALQWVANTAVRFHKAKWAAFIMRDERTIGAVYRAMQRELPTLALHASPGNNREMTFEQAEMRAVTDIMADLWLCFPALDGLPE